MTGIRPRCGGWQAHVKVNGVQYAKQYPLDTPIAEMRAWRDEQVEAHEGEVAEAGSFAADIATYLGQITSLPTAKQKAAHLALWAEALGRTRARRTITTAEINAVLDGWLVTSAPGTVRKRRTTLQSLFVRLDGKLAKNPVKAAQNPKPPKAEARGIAYETIAQIIARMPRQQDVKPGAVAVPALGHLRVAVLAYTGLPPGLLMKVTPTDLNLTTGTVRVSPRRKGRGVEARTLRLTSAGLAAFKAFHAANAYGAFAIEALNRSFKRAAKHVGVDPATVHLYDLRHSFGMQMYRTTRDLATVARYLLHSEGSTVTARYAQGANEAVDVAAAAAFDAALVAGQRGTMKAAPVQKPAKRVTSKGDARRKSPAVKHLRRVV